MHQSHNTTTDLVNTGVNQQDQSNVSTDAMSIDRSDHASIIKNFLSKCGVTIETNNMPSNSLTIEQELAKLSTLPKNGHDHTSFWRLHKESMPILANLARKYLAISASSVPCESMFSISNHVLRKNRLALTSKNIRYTMFLKDKL